MATNNHPNRSSIVKIDGEKFYEWAAKVRIHSAHIEDGFVLTAARLHSLITAELLGSTYASVQTEIVRAPSNHQLLIQQGWKREWMRSWTDELTALKKHSKIYGGDE